MSGEFVFLDIETTGLEPAGGIILEVGVIVTDSTLEHVRAMEQFIVPHSDEDMRLSATDDFVKKMHTKSGLFDHVKAVRVGAEDRVRLRMEHDGVDHMWAAQQVVSNAICTFLDSLVLDKESLCGSSVHFDREWLKYHMPRVLDRFSYRNTDVSSLLEVIRRRWGHEAARSVVVSRGRHRAIEDLQDTIATLRNALDFLADPPQKK